MVTTIIYGHCSQPDCPLNSSSQIMSFTVMTAQIPFVSCQPLVHKALYGQWAVSGYFLQFSTNTSLPPFGIFNEKTCPWIYHKYISRWSLLKIFNSKSEENYLKPLLKLSTNWQVPKQYQATVHISKGRIFIFLLQISFSSSLPQVSFHPPIFLCCKCPLHCRLHVCSLIWERLRTCYHILWFLRDLW